MGRVLFQSALAALVSAAAPVICIAQDASSAAPSTAPSVVIMPTTAPAAAPSVQAIRDARDYNALLIDKYDVRRVLLDKPLLPRLAAALAADPRWEREYADARSEIYRRK